MILLGDIGGTHLRLAASEVPGSFEEPVIVDTPQALDDAVAAFARSATELAHGRAIERAVIGVAGLFSTDGTTLLRAPHLPAWDGAQLAERFGNAVGAPVHTENDAMLGALGEAHAGAGQGASILAYVAVGTGAGGARIVDGQIDRHARGFEIGHLRLGASADAPELESLVSGSGLAARYGRPAAEIDDPAAWDTIADAFALGLYATILHWSPDRVVLGGSAFTGERAIPLGRVRATLAAANTALPDLPDIQLASLADRSALHGALVLAQQ
jgi:glucokinase